MLVKIRLENFKSFDGETELTMVSSSKIRKLPDHCIVFPEGTKLLKNAVVYGANAAGKSNLVDFFRVFLATLSEGVPLWAMDWFSKSSEGNRKKETILEIQFSTGDEFYAYGFSAILNERRITGEWLFGLNSRSGHTKLLKRVRDGQIASDLKFNKEETARFETYSHDFTGNTSSLFLSELNRAKSFTETSSFYVFRKVYEWLCSHVVVFSPNMPLTDFRYYYNNDSLMLVNEMIRTFDTGISEVSIKEINMDDFKRKVPAAVLQDVMRKIQKESSVSESLAVNISMRTQTDFFNLRYKAGEELQITTIQLRHVNSFYDFAFSEESDGTRRVFDLLDILLAKDDDVLFVIDELERSLHPMLTRRFLELFNEKRKSQRSQLLFTTHEDAIMRQELFRRDEIWFVERTELNNSVIYSLDRFKERYDKKLASAYMEGRYGAIPVFSSL